MRVRVCGCVRVWEWCERALGRKVMVCVRLVRRLCATIRRASLTLCECVPDHSVVVDVRMIVL